MLRHSRAGEQISVASVSGWILRANGVMVYKLLLFNKGFKNIKLFIETIIMAITQPFF